MFNDVKQSAATVANGPGKHPRNVLLDRPARNRAASSVSRKAASDNHCSLS